MIDIIGVALAAVLSPLLGEAVCRWVAGVTEKEDTEEKAKLRRKKKRTKRSTSSLLLSVLMAAAVLIMWVNLPRPAECARY